MNLRHTAATFDQETLLATKRSGGVVECWSAGVLECSQPIGSLLNAFSCQPFRTGVVFG
jgi:hypothetical protein